MTLTRTVAPTSSEILALLSVTTMKDNLKISNSAEDTVIQDSILEAYDWLAGEQGWLGRSVLTETWVLTLPGFMNEKLGSDATSAPTSEWVEADVLEVRRGRMVALRKIRYRDEDGDWQTLYDATVSPAVTSDRFHVVTGGTFGRLVLANGKTWPTTQKGNPEAVEITFTAGYGAAAAVLANQKALVKALKLLAGDFYRNREDTYAEPRLVEVPRKIVNGVERIAGQFRIPRSIL